MNSLRAAFLDLLVPVYCAGCGFPGISVCADCRQRGLDNPIGRRITLGPPFLEVWSAADYSGSVRRIVLEYKTRGSPALRPILILWAAQALSVWALASRDPLLVVPLHSGPTTRASANCDVPFQLAMRAVRKLRLAGMDLRLADLIAADRKRERQKELGVRGRLVRARDQPRVRQAGSGHPTGSAEFQCVLFDDVVTTGASLVSAGRALTGAGWDVLGGAALATVQPSAGGSTDA
ncbi:MAG: hypothetical protein Q8P61_05065 [Candidatus Nanopelagicales bacterium]|nr:hypothetical protein [Candidatus Nanopelagicales bacterium]